MENKSSEEKKVEPTVETKDIHQEETFESPDGKWTHYITVMSDGDDVKIDSDWVESEDYLETSDDNFFGEYHD